MSSAVDFRATAGTQEAAAVRRPATGGGNNGTDRRWLAAVPYSGPSVAADITAIRAARSPNVDSLFRWSEPRRNQCCCLHIRLGARSRVVMSKAEEFRELAEEADELAKKVHDPEVRRNLEEVA